MQHIPPILNNIVAGGGGLGPRNHHKILEPPLYDPHPSFPQTDFLLHHIHEARTLVEAW